MSGAIVLGYDGSPSAIGALAATIRLAQETGSSVVVVFAYHISPLGGGEVRAYKEALEKVADHETARAAADLEAAGVPVSVLHIAGRPGDALLETAEETGARMIVVGGPTRGSLTGAVLGSVVLHLVQRSPVPVLVVPNPG